MRIALHVVGEVGRRAGRILLAERALTALGLYGQEGGPTEERRTMAIKDLVGFDLLVTDAIEDASAFATRAADEGIPCVLSVEKVSREVADRFAALDLTLLVGSNLAGLADSLARHEQALTDSDRSITLAWTEPGKARRRGDAVPFPDPVGARWGRRLRRSGRAADALPTSRIVVPLSGPWAGAMAKVEGGVGGMAVTRVVGVADHREHLEAIALAAGAVSMIGGAFGPGRQSPGDAADAYLSTALALGMDVATYTLAG